MYFLVCHCVIFVIILLIFRNIFVWYTKKEPCFLVQELEMCENFLSNVLSLKSVIWVLTMTSSFSNLMAGILPFGAVFIELFFILSVSNQNEVSFLPEVNSCYRNSSLIITSNPFTLLSDQGGVSLYSINTFSRSRVMRKRKCIYIRNGTLFDLVLNSQNKNDKKWMRECRECTFWSWEWKDWRIIVA